MKQSDIIKEIIEGAETTYEEVEIKFNQINPAIKRNSPISELDFIRKEICYCLIMNLNQAAITLTNHLLEKFLKTALIYKEKRDESIQNLKDIESFYANLIDKYADKDLNQTINLCKSKGIITKKVAEDLHDIRDRFRNAYSHADPKKTFGEIKVPVVYGNLKTPGKTENGDIQIKYMPFTHGIVQKKIADANAHMYFSYIDTLIFNSDLNNC